MIPVPGKGIAKGMALTLRRFFEPKVTVQYPEQEPHIAPRHRGRLELLYDEWDNLKCETCFQCAMACPIEVIDMGGTDTKDRFHVHWGPPEQYAERREEQALRRSGRPVPDPTFRSFDPADTGRLDALLEAEDHDPQRLLPILEGTQEIYGYIPVAAIKHISNATGIWYAEVYGTASFYEQLHLEPPTRHTIGICRCPACSLFGGGQIRTAVEQAAGVALGGTTTDGSLSIEPADCHGENGGEPWVTLDGVRREGVTASNAALLVRSTTGARETGGMPAGQA
ncbi:MAG: NAD(P)H-dependent oxidoreductase subunit E [Chloroflexi bacterium]|nr:NAD(P)H-dependent oxidoreductase subunit E [Chloroflexota bacterium]